MAVRKRGGRRATPRAPDPTPEEPPAPTPVVAAAEPESAPEPEQPRSPDIEECRVMLQRYWGAQSMDDLNLYEQGIIAAAIRALSLSPAQIQLLGASVPDLASSGITAFRCRRLRHLLEGLAVEAAEREAAGATA